MAGNTFVTQSGFSVSSTAAANTCVTQIGATGSFTTSFTVRTTQIGLAPTAWTAFRTQVTRIGLSVSVITCSSSSYVPPAPSNVVALSVTSPSGVLRADLAWTALDGFTYAIYRGLSSEGEDMTPIVMGLTANFYSDMGVTGGRRYFYIVKATNPCGDVTTSNEVSIMMAGFVVPPEGTTTDHLNATDVCCDGLWAEGQVPCPQWIAASGQSADWAEAVCPPTSWTLPRCADE